MRRLTLLFGGLTIVAAVAFSAGMAVPAGASASVQSCAKASGNASGDIVLTKCTGGLGKGSAKATSLASGGTIKWTNGTTTFTGTPKASGKGVCPKGSTEYVFTGTVTADTSGKVKVGTHVLGKACLTSKGKISLVKHTKFTF